jgi:predicted P-loop ATPase
MLILEGRQGLRKSGALKAICGEQWFTEAGEIESKDVFLKMRGKWIIEFPELEGFNRAEATRIKAFVSTAIDSYRKPYARDTIDVPRQCIFAGSTNQSHYLKDETGNRRFWPVKCSGVTDSNTANIEWLAAVRDQIWAEAYKAWKGGEIWWSDTELEALAVPEQAQRQESDAWQELVDKFCESRTEVTVAEILAGDIQCGTLVSGIGKPASQWSRSDEMRVSRCLVKSGWKQIVQKREGKTRRVYVKASSEE